MQNENSFHSKISFIYGTGGTELTEKGWYRDTPTFGNYFH